VRTSFLSGGGAVAYYLTRDVASFLNILEMAALPNVVVQVLPYEVGAHPAMESNFTILELPDPTPGVVFVEGLIGSTYLERPEDLKRYNAIFNDCKILRLVQAIPSIS
jgi:hypothetical protein